MILFPFLVVLTVCSSKIALHPVSSNFAIEKKEMYDRPGVKCVYLPLAGNLVNASVHAVFGGSLLPHVDETKRFVTSFVCIFIGIVWPGVCERCSCIRNFIFYCTVYCLGVDDIVDIKIYIYNISLIGFP